MKKWERFSKEEIKQFVKDSTSYAQLARKIGYDTKISSGGAIKSIHQMIDELGLDVSHFKGQGWSKGRTYESSKYIPFDEYILGEKTTTDKIRRKLLKEGLKNPVCEKCGNSTWLGMPIPLEVHHIDGDRNNNALENLQILCPNCHAFTPNYRGRNIINKNDNKQIITYKVTQNHCTDCGKIIRNNSIRCRECEIKRKQKESIECMKITRDELKDLIRNNSFASIGRKFNVSDTTIKKWCRKNELPYKKSDILMYSDKEWENI